MADAGRQRAMSENKPIMNTLASESCPTVSVCMPHLNSRPFTEERIRTILQQTLADWELIIVDSGSDDGSRELLEQCARRDPRVRLMDAPRDGIYPNLNRALRLCRGKFVYVATSDDTMATDCLEKMVAALESNPNCGLCHCSLEIIDENGHPVAPDDAWDNYAPQKYFGEWIQHPHIRRAPHDGLLHLGFATVYTSLTQLLVRRRVYEDLGLFRTDCQSHADFEWGLRVSLIENVVHIPQKLATWRRHHRQATQPDQVMHARASGEFHRLAVMTLHSLHDRNPLLAVDLEQSTLLHFYLVDEFKARRILAGSPGSRLARTAQFAARHPRFFLHWIVNKVFRRQKITGDFGEAVKNEFQRLGLTNLLVRLDTVCSSPNRSALPSMSGAMFQASCDSKPSS